MKTFQENAADCCIDICRSINAAPKLRGPDQFDNIWTFGFVFFSEQHVPSYALPWNVRGDLKLVKEWL